MEGGNENAGKIQSSSSVMTSLKLPLWLLNFHATMLIYSVNNINIFNPETSNFQTITDIFGICNTQELK